MLIIKNKSNVEYFKSIIKISNCGFSKGYNECNRCFKKKEQVHMIYYCKSLDEKYNNKVENLIKKYENVKILLLKDNKEFMQIKNNTNTTTRINIAFLKSIPKDIYLEFEARINNE